MAVDVHHFYILRSYLISGSLDYNGRAPLSTFTLIYTDGAIGYLAKSYTLSA